MKMPKALPRAYSYTDFVKALPIAARDKVVELLGTAPDQTEFEKFARSWAARCIPPLHYRLAKELVMIPDADPKDLIEGVAQYVEASAVPIQGLLIPSGKLNALGVVEIVALIMIDYFCAYYGKVVEDLAEIAKFRATLERMGSGLRVPPDKRAEIKEKLGTTLIDIDTYLKTVEDSTSTGQTL